MLLRWFSLLLAIALLYCLLVNAIDYFSRNDPSVFFYHALVKPLSQHAVYFSIYICIALFFLIDTAGKKEFLFYKSFHFFLIIYLSVFLFLLSSKLVISVYLLFLIYIILSSLRRKINLFLLLSLLLAIVLTVFILLVSRNPVSNRFREIIDTDLKLIKQTRYEPDIYFNDVQLRLIEWKLVTEILNEKNSWLTGAGMGDAQDLLDKKYREKNMYLGEPGRGDKGYLGYNTHNQLLESLLQSGIPGAILFLLILLSMVWMAIHKKNRLLSFTILLLVMYSLFESVFETQYGILLFTFFPLFLSLKAEKTKSEVQQA
jgi:O-antigen ligase